ncbi:MAG: hypothetical protein DMF89_26070 [Acidobacteria bacterium]|nr:MAG: hypothetical protein DMF89_26070 [Acidobacteriota bacterium]
MSRARPWRVSTAMDWDTELALVERLRQGDADAFDAVHLAFNRLVFTFLVRLSRRRDVAEDLLEETWLRFVKHATRLRADTRLGPWLFTVARNLHVSYQRSRALEDSAAASLMALTMPGHPIWGNGMSPRGETLKAREAFAEAH